MNQIIGHCRSLTRLVRTPMRIQQSVACCLATSTLVAQSFSPVVSPALTRSTHHPNRHSVMRFMSTVDGDVPPFRVGEEIQVEVVSFGPMGASVDVVGMGHSADSLIPETDPALGMGLVLQKEIHYFRQARDNVDVVQGEVLPAYVEYVNEDGKLNISLRKVGGLAKAEEVSKMILDRLEWSSAKSLPLGDKSSPEEIAREFPGVSKGAFKKAIGALYRQGKLKPGPNSISVMEDAK